MNKTTFQGDGKVVYVPVVVNTTQKPITNADRIRNMTDEELAEWIAGYALGLTGASLEMSTHAWFGWLKQEANDAN